MDKHVVVDNPLFYIVLYLTAAVIAVPVFRRIGLGSILGYLTAGVIIGPSVLGFITTPEETLHIAEIGVVMLLFVIGLELQPEKLWAMKTYIFGLGLIQLLGSATLIALIAAVLFGWSQQTAFIIGLALALSSTAFAIQTMTESGILATDCGRKGFSMLLLQDIAVIPILVWIQSLNAQSTEGISLPLSLLAITGTLLIARFLLNPLLKLIAAYGNREVMTAAALLIVLGTAMTFQNVGLSMGLGAFIAGIMLANSSFRHQLEADVQPFKNLLLGLFFISIGMSLDLNLFFQNWWGVLLAAIGLLILKFGIIAALLRFSHSPLYESLRVGAMLSQGGEFAFVIMTQAVANQSIDNNTASLVSLCVGISMALTIPFLKLIEKIFVRIQINYDQNDTADDTIDEYEPEVIIIGFGRFGQIPGRILTANGIRFTALDRNAQHISFVRQFGNKVYYGDPREIDLLEAAGIAQAKAVIIAIDEEDDALDLVELIREEFPKVRIIARAADRMHAMNLYDKGAHYVIRELLEGSIDAAREMMECLGYTRTQAMRAVGLFRETDERLFERARNNQRDLDMLIKIGAEGREELKELFDKDQELIRKASRTT